jgi:methylmalonyl-CoA mutase N-terminal domain/subunit
VVGINAGRDDGAAALETVEPFKLPPGALDAQRRRIEAVRARRDEGAVAGALEAVAAAATAGENVMGAIGDAVAADATVGEIGTVLRDSLGRWHFPLW